MENTKKSIISDDELDLISGGVRGKPRRPQTTQADWSMPENYAINGVTYQEALMKRLFLAKTLIFIDNDVFAIQSEAL